MSGRLTWLLPWLVLSGARLSLGSEVAFAVASPAETNNVEQQRRPRGAVAPGVYKARITPHWFHNNSRFWYRNDLRDGAKEFVVVDAESARRQLAFDHARLAVALAKATGEKYESERSPDTMVDCLSDAPRQQTSVPIRTTSSVQG